VNIVWTRRASDDVERLKAFLMPVAPEAAERAALKLIEAPDRLRDFPRIGVRLENYAPREVRHIFVDYYELRYEIVDMTIYIVRLWYSREDRRIDTHD
jgi:plasmid stabilization system protein ParE